MYEIKCVGVLSRKYYPYNILRSDACSFALRRYSNLKKSLYHILDWHDSLHFNRTYKNINILYLHDSLHLNRTYKNTRVNDNKQ